MNMNINNKNIYFRITRITGIDFKKKIFLKNKDNTRSGLWQEYKYNFDEQLYIQII